MSDKKQVWAEKKACRKGKKLEKARTFQEQHTEKEPRRFHSNFENRKDHHPAWQFSLLDWEGEWGWQNLTPETWQNILEKLKNFESMTWGEIESGDQNDSSHEVLLKDCPNTNVRKRLEELKLDDIDSLFSLRLSGKERIYGILEGSVLKLLWFDPEHTIWPVEKKHT
jgi:hypothetical protein